MINFGIMEKTKEYFDTYLNIIKSDLTDIDLIDINYILNEIINLNVYNNDFVSVEENDIVMDIGVNFGLFTLDALQYNPKKIIGFEPNPKLVNCCNKMNIPKAEIIQGAVSHKNGKTTFYESNYPGRSSLHMDMNSDTLKSSYDVDIYDINDILNLHEKINYLKVDCEGAEYEIFEAIDLSTLSNKINKIALEFHHIPTDLKVINLISKIESAGFEIKVDFCGSGTTGMLYAKKP